MFYILLAIFIIIDILYLFSSGEKKESYRIMVAYCIFAFILYGIWWIWYHLCLGEFLIEEGFDLGFFLASILGTIAFVTLVGGLIAIAFGWDPDGKGRRRR